MSFLVMWAGGLVGWLVCLFVTSTVLAQGSTDQTGISGVVVSSPCKPVFLFFFSPPFGHGKSSLCFPFHAPPLA